MAKKSNIKIERTKKGLYTARISVLSNGVWKSIRVTKNTKRELEYEVSRLRLASSKGEAVSQKDWKLFEFMNTFYETYKEGNVVASTQNAYENAFREAKEFFGDVKLKSITPLKYQQFINHLGESLAYNTVDTRHKKMRAMFNKAVELDYISRNPTYGVTLKGKDVAFNKMQFLQEDQVKQMDSQIKSLPFSVSRMVIFIALRTGMRFGEIIALTKFDIDKKKSIIKVTKSYDYKDTKKFIPTKTKEHREIFITKETMDFLIEYLKWYDDRLKSNGIDNKMNLLFCASSSLPIDNQSCNKELKKLCASFDKLGTITLHKLRHTHTIECFVAGMDIIYVSERLGHKDINTTMKYYTHVSQQIRKINEEKLTHFFDAK